MQGSGGVGVQGLPRARGPPRRRVWHQLCSECQPEPESGSFMAGPVLPQAHSAWLGQQPSGHPGGAGAPHGDAAITTWLAAPYRGQQIKRLGRPCCRHLVYTVGQKAASWGQEGLTDWPRHCPFPQQLLGRLPDRNSQVTG